MAISGLLCRIVSRTERVASPSPIGRSRQLGAYLLRCVVDRPWTAPPLAVISHLTAGRSQIGTSLSFHLFFAVLGVGLPLMMLVAEGMHLRTGDPVWRALARRWSKVFAVLFAVGAASGTIISFELGLLFPRFMAYAGGIIGLPFSLEGAAFFLEAIFVGIYLYGWDRLSPRATGSRASRSRSRRWRRRSSSSPPTPG